jgi:hypothetical protein
MLEYGEVYLENNARRLEQFRQRAPAAYALAVEMAREMIEDGDWDETE